MKTILITFFILMIPAIGALGFDYYRFYTADPTLDQEFMLAEVGWLWVTYHESSHNAAVEAVGEDMWAELVAPLMSLDAVLLLSIPALLIFGVMMSLKTFGVGPYEGEGLLASKAKKVSSFSTEKAFKKKGKTKYKRK